jgi:hypothetical protein
MVETANEQRSAYMEHRRYATLAFWARERRHDPAPLEDAGPEWDLSFLGLNDIEAFDGLDPDEEASGVSEGYPNAA